MAAKFKVLIFLASFFSLVSAPTFSKESVAHAKNDELLEKTEARIDKIDNILGGSFINREYKNYLYEPYIVGDIQQAEAIWADIEKKDSNIESSETDLPFAYTLGNLKSVLSAYLCEKELHPKSKSQDFQHCNNYLESTVDRQDSELFLTKEFTLLKSGRFDEVFESIEERFQVSLNPFDIDLADLGPGSEYTNLDKIYELLGDTFFELAEYQKAARFYEAALILDESNFFESGQFIKGTPSNVLFYATSLLRSGNYNAAEKEILRALNEYENRVQASYGLNDLSLLSGYANYGSDIYSLLQELKVDQGKKLEALEVAERSKARDLSYRLGIATNPNEISGAIQSLELSDIREVASEQSATIIQYSILPKSIWDREGELLIWLIKPEGDIIFEKYNFDDIEDDYKQALDSRTFWEKLFARLRSIGNTESGKERLEDSSVSSIIDTTLISSSNDVRGALSDAIDAENCSNEVCLRLLYDILISPIESHLPDKPEQHVVFIPQGDIFRVPFPALKNSSDEYLIDNHTVRTAPSIESLRLARQLSKSKSLDSGTPLVVGNPSLPKVDYFFDDKFDTLDNLSEAEAEAKEVANLLQVQPITGKEATEHLIKEKITKASIIHFAAHGIIDAVTDEGIISSALLLSDSEKDDGLLTDSELYQMYEIDASLAVLSACNTQIGDIISEGVVSLARPFISVGVPSVVASLWSVPDKSTSDLMIKFYESLDTDPDVASALRQAMLTVKGKNKNFTSWAGFTLIGEPLINMSVDESERSTSQTKKIQRFLTIEQLENAEYPATGMRSDPINVKLVNGEYVSEDPEPINRFSITIAPLKAVGNLDGDAQLDAVVILTESGAMGAGLRYLVPVLNKNGSPVNQEMLGLGYAAPINSMKIEDSIFTIETSQHRMGDPNCCPSQLVEDIYIFSEGKLNHVSRRNIN